MSNKSTTSQMAQWWQSSQLAGVNSAYLDEIYENYLADPTSVESSWRDYFDQLTLDTKDVSHQAVRQAMIQYVQHPHQGGSSTQDYHQATNPGIWQLINAYREYGHFYAQTDPLKISETPSAPLLSAQHYGVSATDLEQVIKLGTLTGSQGKPAKQVIDQLAQIYTGSVGYEYTHVADARERDWLQQRIEKGPETLDGQTKQMILQQLTASEGLEKALGNRYVGQKRFSIEGGESLIPALETILESAAANGAEESILGMAHRGRLNVLVNVLGKSYQSLCDEFEDKQEKHLIGGDVKYHQGQFFPRQLNQGPMALTMAYNPSHLETVDAVVEGMARAQQDKYGNMQKVVPILMHGDSAFCGQGVVMETLALSQTRHYSTGGTVHIISNNQVGFTTSKRQDNRSSWYVSDTAKMIQAPVFHVNGDDPEAVVHVAKLAFDYRQAFGKDVVIDLVCYRRHGHNEADEPSGTQPHMYAVIKKHPTTRAVYAQQLQQAGVIDSNQAKQWLDAYKARLNEGKDIVEKTDQIDFSKQPDWSRFAEQNWQIAHQTTLDPVLLKQLAQSMCHVPEGFVLQKQVEKTLQERLKMASEEIDCNWGFAENLAYASLLHEGYHVRLTGEDSGRGTFSHRHAVLHNANLESNDSTYIPLQHINREVECVIGDSILSEYGVLGFEYGYSLMQPQTLTLWEAQFGDFANTAQVVIDQYIASAEEKWGIQSGLVMLLPHGQEGMGPEHSSARPERFLQLCAHHNMQVCVPTTPSQMFHMLRRQVKRDYRKPLIVMTPKSLLRHPLVKSSMASLATGYFMPVIDEIDQIEAKSVKKVVLCSGKFYYDLLEARREQQQFDCAIVRVEQLYPFPDEVMSRILAEYPNAKSVVWAQEEPANQGAWSFIQPLLQPLLQASQTLSYAGRERMAAPAVGYPSRFKAQQKAVIDDVLNNEKELNI